MTDIAKYRNDNDPRFVIQNWMRNRNTVEFLAVWEELHNPDFNRVPFEADRSEAGRKCDYKKQVHEEMLDASVTEVIVNWLVILNFRI